MKNIVHIFSLIWQEGGRQFLCGWDGGTRTVYQLFYIYKTNYVWIDLVTPGWNKPTKGM